MRPIGSLLFALLLHGALYAQRINPSDRMILQQKQDSLKSYSVKLIMGINSDDRFKADSSFTRMLVRALKLRNSFYYVFDSLQTISQLYAPDSSFRVFTWQLVINDNVIRQHGAIQMRTYDGSLKLYPLIDKSDVTKHLQDTIGNNLGWIGAIYYKIIQKKSLNQNYYTLLGFDENSIKSNRKFIEVLTFSNDEPLFGGRYFSFEEDSVFKSAISRYVMEYKKDAGPRLTYDPDLDMIIVEHLTSESNEPNKKWTLIGDGDYEGFKWKGGKWVHVEKVYHYITPEGKEPVPKPLKDNNGNLLEDKQTLEEIQTQSAQDSTSKKPVIRKKKGGDD